MSGTKRRILILGAIGLLMIYYGLKLYRAPLESYTWTELLINYAAGFIHLLSIQTLYVQESYL